MSPQDIEKLLGGYATDTLNDEERRTLFEAALGNQALFDALADEQALRELLQDEPSRAHLLAALGEDRVPPLARLAAWLRRPSVLGLAAAVAAGIVTVAVVIPRRTPLERPATVAMNKPPQPEQVEAQLEKQAASVKAPETKTPETRRVIERVERDALKIQNAPASPPPPAKPTLPAEPAGVSAAAPPPPPAPVMAPPAPSTTTATVEVQEAQAKLAETSRPASAGLRMEDRKESQAPGARDLYYAVQPAAVSGFVNQPLRAAKARQRAFGGGAGVVGGVPTPPAAARAGGVRYSILKRNSDGSFAEVDPATIFAVGDALRVRFETNQAGNLGVMERQANGQWTLRMGARTQQGEPVHMPSESTINVTAPGAMRFFVRFSRNLRSEPSLDSIAPTAGLLRQDAANSMYVVNPAWTADAAVDFELTINAK